MRYASFILSLAVGCARGSDVPAERDAGNSGPTLSAAEQPGCAALAVDPAQHAAVYAIGQELAPHQEVEICALHRVGKQDVWLNSSDVMLSPGAHHGLLWQTRYADLPAVDQQGDPIVLDEIMRCDGGANGRFDVTRPLAGSQSRANLTGSGALPKDVAVRIPAESYVVLNLHMLNTAEEPTAACMKVGLNGIAAEQVKHEAGVLFFYDVFITVPAKERSQVRMACPITRDISLVSAVSHMHKLGVGYRANLLAGDPLDSSTTTLQTLYETDVWDEPQDKFFAEALKLKAGQWIDYSCQYENPTDRNVAQGLQTVDEMCMFSGLYWPYDEDLTYCTQADGGIDGSGSGGYQIGSGTLDGPAFMQCVLNADYAGGATEPCGFASCRNYPARYAWQACFTSACPSIGKYTRSYLECISANNDGCRAQCNGASGASANDGTCVLDCFQADRCKSQVDALRATPCD